MRNKKLLLFITSLMLIMGTLGCGKGTKEDKKPTLNIPETIETTSNKEEKKNTTKDDTKEETKSDSNEINYNGLYKNYVSRLIETSAYVDDKDYLKYDYVYVNNDTIPELVITKEYCYVTLLTVYYNENIGDYEVMNLMDQWQDGLTYGEKLGYVSSLTYDYDELVQYHKLVKINEDGRSIDILTPDGLSRWLVKDEDLDGTLIKELDGVENYNDLVNEADAWYYKNVESEDGTTKVVETNEEEYAKYQVIENENKFIDLKGTKTFEEMFGK